MQVNETHKFKVRPSEPIANRYNIFITYLFIFISPTLFETIDFPFKLNSSLMTRNF